MSLKRVPIRIEVFYLPQCPNPQFNLSCKHGLILKCHSDTLNSIRRIYLKDSSNPTPLKRVFDSRNNATQKTEMTSGD